MVTVGDPSTTDNFLYFLDLWDSIMGKAHDHLFVTQDVVEAALGTLAALTAVVSSTKIDSSRAHGAFIPWLEFNWSFRAKTVGQGPILFGVTNMSAVELTEAFAADPQNKNDKEAMERASRGWYKVLAAAPAGLAAGSMGGTYGPSWEKVKIGLTMPEGKTLSSFHLNADDGALTTGTLVEGTIRIGQKWMSD